MKHKIAVALTVALLALPLSTTFTLADTASSSSTTTVSATTTSDTAEVQAEAAVSAYEAAPITTLVKIATANGLKAAADTAVAAVTDVTAKEDFELRVTHRAAAIAIATTILQAEAAVSAYETAPITTLAEVAKAEGLKAAADTAVAATADVTAKTAFEFRITNRAAAIARTKTVLQAEAAVSVYEAAPITTLAKITKAEGLKAAADTAVAAVANGTVKTAFELRITNRAAAIANAKTLLTPVVDDNGNTVTPSNWITDLIGKLQLALTFDPAHKAELNERHALAKLAEAQKLMKARDPEAAQTCLNEYTDKITKAQAFLEQVKDPTSETAKTLAKALVNVNSNNVQVLSNLLDKLPPQAAQKLALNVVRSMDKAVQKIQKEDAKVTSETTSTTSATDNDEVLKKQAKVALENFKKSLNQKGKIHIEDQEQENDGDQKVVKQSKPEQEKLEKELKSQKVIKNQSPQIQAFTQGQPTHVTVAPIKSQVAPTVTKPSEHGTVDRSKRAENEKDKDGYKAENHRNNE
ncbi:DUF5667 domain-containing protein [Desulfosporosinus sp. OT]|uniref:DUF5667 domain-containing protein n=1 Tax=Desulfosporosinus sp. OT TaxID=913865 RepID=UPI000223A796|nr:DUF5667 domain-containing protein [Desulfosporosinus sp. OT]EGW38448.1 hypothetical protein DOT_3732 [Desulfosporosinus sp. OT]